MRAAAQLIALAHFDRHRVACHEWLQRVAKDTQGTSWACSQVEVALPGQQRARGWSGRGLEADVRGQRYGVRLTTSTLRLVMMMGVLRRAEYPAAAGHGSGRYSRSKVATRCIQFRRGRAL
jgi:hypothetical protein